MNLFLTLLKSECLNRRRIGSPGVFSADSPEFISVEFERTAVSTCVINEGLT